MKAHLSSQEKPSADVEAAKRCFGTALRAARERAGLNQAKLAKRIAKSRVVVSNYESGHSAPESDQAIELAKVLDEDPETFLLLATLQKGLLRAGPSTCQTLVATVHRLLERSAGHGGSSDPRQHGLPECLSLADGIDAFSPMVVFVGDKREEEPQSAGDLFVFSASTVDDRWLLTLGLPRSTEKISDKVLMTADEAWLRKQFGRTHILAIGSPASNLFSRQFNDQFLFRFAISRTTQRKWEQTRQSMLSRRTPAMLLQFYDESKPDLKQTMRMFKPPGFVDFNYTHLTLGMDLSYGKDFAVISLGTNPFAEPGAPYFAILAAGVHHPGTAHAVRFLGEADHFAKHPFGGVLEVEVPSKKCDPRDIFWHNKIENCHADWHTAGQNQDGLQHDLATMRASLKRWAGQLADSVVVDIALEKDEIERHMRLINTLVKMKHPDTHAPERD